MARARGWHDPGPARHPGPPLLQDLDDAELVRRCRDGELAAWSTLVRRYQSLIYTVPRRAGLSEDQAADVFQVAFERLHRHLPRLEDGARVRAWLVTTAKHETLRLLGEARRFAPPPPAADGEDADPLAQLPDPAPLQDEQLSQLQDVHRVRQAVERLEPRLQQFVELVFLQDEPLPYTEVAERLGIPVGSIGPTRARCLAKLRKLLEGG